MDLNFRKLKADEIECRVGSCSKDATKPWCTLLLYKDARVDMRLLDEHVGALNWKREHALINGQLFCTVSIYDEDKGEWISKQDVGTESNTEAVKGQASDAFKRACFNVGIGRELYTAPFIYIKGGGKNTKAYVKEIGYDEVGNINHLVILGQREGKGATECLFDLKVPKNVASVDKGQAQPSMASQAGQQPSTAVESGGKPLWMKRADAATSLENLRVISVELIEKGQWGKEQQNYFNNISKQRGWI